MSIKLIIKIRWFNILLIPLLYSTPAFSQTIINAERLMGGADSTIYAASLSYTGTRGNSNTDRLEISPAFILLKSRNDFKLFGGYSLLAQSGNEILNSGFIHLRHNYKIKSWLKTFEFYQLQFNDVLLLRKREVIGAGLRVPLADKVYLKFDISLGLMKETEILNETSLSPGELSETRYLRGTSTASIKLVISKVFKIDNVLYYQPYLKDFSDYRLLNDINLTVSVTDHFEYTTILTTRYDSKPPGSLKNMDNVLSIGFNVKF